MPEGVARGHPQGHVQAARGRQRPGQAQGQLLGSGAILNEVVAAQKMLEKYGVAADVWSVTSYQELYRDGHACDRWNMLHPDRRPQAVCHAVLRERDPACSSPRPTT